MITLFLINPRLFLAKKKPVKKTSKPKAAKKPTKKAKPAKNAVKKSSKAVKPKVTSVKRAVKSKATSYKRPSIAELLRRSPEDWQKEGAVFEQEFSPGFDNSDDESDFAGED